MASAIESAMQGLKLKSTLSTKCFDPASINHLASKPRMEVTEPVRYVFVSIIATAGLDTSSRTSKFTIVSMCHYNWDAVIVGIEDVDTMRIKDYENVLIHHLMRIRLKPMFENATFVVNIGPGIPFSYEMANGKSLICDVVHNVMFMFDCHFDDVSQPGTTTIRLKAEMMEIAFLMLYVDELSVLSDLVVYQEHPHIILGMLFTQLCACERIVIPSLLPGHLNRVIISGEGHDTKSDDLAVAFQRCCFTRQVFLLDEKYAQYRT